MRGESEKYIFQGEMPPRPFNALARKYAKQLRDGRWVLPASKVNKIYEQILDGRIHIEQFGQVGLDQLGDFLESRERKRSS